MGILEELRLCTTRIPNNANVNIPTQIDAFMGKLMDTAQKQDENCPLDVLVTKNCWSYAINKLIKEVGSVPHFLDFIKFFRLPWDSIICA